MRALCDLPEALGLRWKLDPYGSLLPGSRLVSFRFLKVELCCFNCATTKGPSETKRDDINCEAKTKWILKLDSINTLRLFQSFLLGGESVLIGQKHFRDQRPDTVKNRSNNQKMHTSQATYPEYYSCTLGIIPTKTTKNCLIKIGAERSEELLVKRC